VGSLALGASKSLTITATVNLGTAGQTITNTASVTHSDQPDAVAGNNSASASVTVQARTVAVLVDPDQSKTVDAGTQVFYPLTVTNNGNLTDVIDLTTASTAGWTWAFRADTNGDGLLDGGDTLLTDSDGDGKVDVTLAPGSSTKVLAVTTVPYATANAAVDTTTVTGASSHNTAVTDTALLRTTVRAPAITLSKTVDSSSAVPGTVLLYTIHYRNTGGATATFVIIGDAIPAFTTYKAGSLRVGSGSSTYATATPKTDDPLDGDGAGVSGASVTVTVSSVAPDDGVANAGSDEGKIYFQVTVQ
jgi:uncharacterized repeat protein (TIGR01451 family)